MMFKLIKKKKKKILKYFKLISGRTPILKSLDKKVLIIKRVYANWYSRISFLTINWSFLTFKDSSRKKMAEWDSLLYSYAFNSKKKKKENTIFANIFNAVPVKIQESWTAILLTP